MQLPATLVNPETGATILVDTAEDYVSLVFDCGYQVQLNEPPSSSAPPPQLSTPPSSTQGGASAPAS